MTPMTPVAPLRLSITIDQPCWALIHWAMTRGMPSYGPPAGQGTMMRIEGAKSRQQHGRDEELGCETAVQTHGRSPGGDPQSSIRPTIVFRYDGGSRQPSWRASRRLDQCGGLLHDRLRRAVSLCQKRVDFGRRQRLDLQLRLVRVGAKVAIGERGVEGAPQRGETIGRHAGGRGKR